MRDGLFSLIHVLCNISYGRLVKNMDCSRETAFSPQSPFIPESAHADRVNRRQPCLFRRYARRRAFCTKTRTIILFTTTTLNRLGFKVTATGHSHFRYNKTEDMLMYQSHPVGVELFSYVNTFVT